MRDKSNHKKFLTIDFQVVPPRGTSIENKISIGVKIFYFIIMVILFDIIS